MARYAFRGGRVVDVDFVPLRQEDLRVAPLEADDKARLIAKLADLSRALGRRR